jgi:Ca2+-binding RTX toxin-like protein
MEAKVAINGTSEDDEFYGTRFDDEINGQGGNDIFLGSRGQDVLNGNSGFDGVDYSVSYTVIPPFGRVAVTHGEAVNVVAASKTM